MKQFSLTIILVLFSLSSVRSAKYASEAFSLGVGGRGMALGGAVVAGAFDGSAAYWNPAGLNLLNGRYIMAMHAETFGSLLNHDFIAYTDARYSHNSLIKAFGFYIYYLGGGGIKITQLDEFNRPYVIKEESHGDYLLSAALAGKLSSRLDFGLTAKIILRDIGTETGKGLTVDAGFLYKANRYLNIGLMITDVTTGFIRYSGKTFNESSHTESIYPAVKPGLMLKYSYRDYTGRFLMSGDIRFENIKYAAQYWSGSLSLDTHYGWELAYRNMVFGRFGFDMGNFTAGGGVSVKNISLDFAYLHHDELDETYRVSAGYRF
ncbi:MAG: PorV/PorQ family protein [FCB group bacterium]|nr:PorV/PorQ family protein [FCB group bacterium]